MAEDFAKNVFINCPFDDDYRPLLEAIVFTVLFFGYNPRLALEQSGSGNTRIDKILGLVEESCFGIHDLSRMVSSDEGEHYRMNMPFELGIDYGCLKLKGGKWKDKRILVLEKEKFRYRQALSDLSGSDIKNHDDEPYRAVEAVRDWLVTEVFKRGASGRRVWDDFNDFQAYLYDEVVEKDGHESVDEVMIPEKVHHMKNWFTLKR